MERKTFLIFFLVLLIVQPLVSAQPPFQNPEFSEGFSIVGSEQIYLKLNQDYQMNWFVYNNSNGFLIDNSSATCVIYIINNTGSVTLNQTALYDGYWYYNILRGNFSNIGIYNLGISCSDVTNGQGGAYSDYFMVTKTGFDFESKDSLMAISNIIVSIAVMFLFLIFGIKLTEKEKLYPIGFLFLIFSVFFCIYLLHQSFVYTSLIPGLSLIENSTGTIYFVVLWTLSGIAIISFVLMLIAFIKELGNTVKKRKFGEDFNPITNSYE